MLLINAAHCVGEFCHNHLELSLCSLVVIIAGTSSASCVSRLPDFFDSARADAGFSGIGCGLAVFRMLNDGLRNRSFVVHSFSSFVWLIGIVQPPNKSADVGQTIVTEYLARPCGYGVFVPDCVPSDIGDRVVGDTDMPFSFGCFSK